MLTMKLPLRSAAGRLCKKKEKVAACGEGCGAFDELGATPPAVLSHSEGKIQEQTQVGAAFSASMFASPATYSEEHVSRAQQSFS